ncbi:hypothetical protein ANANG_G00074280 [Anguilla anguilla]|uniref:Phosphoribosylaminoimidazolesuccinocarboxamide synthase n=1 Tax=Anguilla anguilla TaxID=7936 RepID=A0A9D3MIS1_ANGAN|nr:hypothetical protein ANANG_G00074280 [Anguilla anguilla]
MAYYQDLASTPAPADTPGGAPGPQPQEGEEPSRTRQEESRYFTATVRPGKEAEQAEVELGKHWTNAEVQALLHTWAERREELRGAARNKSIFLEMSRQLQQLGVERSWKQCRTKYKNLRYDYKSARNSHATPNSDAKHMRFYSQVDAIEQGRDLGSTWRGPERDQATPMNQGDTTPLDGNSDWRPGGGADMGRNWQDEEVRALIAIWGEEPVRQRLESAARNRDVFQHISLRLQRLGVERDWKQCRTKYKNLKYISRSLQRTPPSHAHSTPSFYREVDAILSKGTMAQAPPTHLPKGEPEQRSTPITCTGNQATANSPHLHSSEIISPVTVCVCSLSLEHIPSTGMASAPDLKIGKKLNEGKTKEIYELSDQPGHVLVQSKDQITAGNAVRKDQMEGKAAIANRTTSCVFRLLQDAGIKTAFVKQHSDTAFVAAHCEMIPIEWVCRRVATGSFLKRNPGVKEGYRFSPPKIEMFFKDDANNDPQWSEEQLLEAQFCLAGLSIGRCEVDIMSHSTLAIFEILERAWATQNCTLVDMKIEFGVNVVTKEVVLADVIDNDSWRLWPAGDRSQQKDKQVYRDLKEVTPEAMQIVKRNFEWVSERVELLLEPQARGRVLVLMGSVSDLAHCERIRSACAAYGVPCSLRVSSAHKGPTRPCASRPSMKVTASRLCLWQLPGGVMDSGR